jgi:outer membrane protein OmpA-like peptidoglycan-associated protein
MKDKFDIVSGDFEGNFYTHQKAVLSASESTIDKKHDIHLYRGELRNIKNENEYNPEQLRNRESYLLHNVTNVQFHLEKDATGNNNRIYNFEQILLRDAVIKESWELNGKTYGIITGKLLGKVKDEVKPPDPTNPQEPPKPPPIIPNPIIPKPPRRDPDPIPGIVPPPPLIGSGCLNIGNGCMPASGCFSFFSGCLTNIWRLLLALLLLLFILWFLKGCWDKKEARENCCSERDSLSDRLTELKDSLVNTDIQNELDKLSSKIYFFGDSTGIRKINHSKINQIVNILNKHKNLNVTINGYMNSLTSNNNHINNLDYERAKSVEMLLIEKGIEKSRLTSRGMGHKNIVPIDLYDSIFDETSNKYLKFNKNMRVELKIKNTR